MPSLRARLVARTTAVLVLTFVVAALTLYYLMRTALVAELDAALLLEARSLVSHVEWVGKQINVELYLTAFPEYYTPSRPHFFEIRDRAGRAVARSPSLETHELDLQASGNVSTAQAFVVL